jgi:hypothetical protein
MLTTKTKLTNRKFYGKWLYKTTIKLEGCSLFRTKTLSDIKDFCQSPEPTEHRYSVYTRAYKNKDEILEICLCLEKYDKKSYATRIEQNYIDFYSNDKKFYEEISLKFENILKHRFEPDESTKNILDQNNSSITVKKLPKNRYNYRVFLLPHKMNGDKEEKEKYINWLKNQNPRVTCTPAIEKWFISTDWNWDRRYILVEDEATLLMLKLRNSDVVGRIYNFVVADK